MRAHDDVLAHLRRARDHADRHYDQPLTLAQLAAVAALSPWHFQRLFTVRPGCRGPRRPCESWGAVGCLCYEELLAKGVTSIQPPAERPYGVEALMRDNSGNWMVLVEHRDFDPSAMTVEDVQ